MLLDGRVAFVTGAGGRIGRALVGVLAREGADVACVDLTPETAGGAVAQATEEGRRGHAIAADVTQPDEISSAVAEAEDRLGPVDILVNAAGIFPNRLLVDMPVEEWDRVFAVNVRGTMLTCQAFARRWIERGTRGAIVNLSSGAATSARAGSSHYCGSKAAVNMLTHVLAIELGPHGIRVNAVAPGLVLDSVVTTHEREQHPYIGMMLDATPMGRTGSPADIAEAVAFLASERSAWTTGSIVEVTGGSHCGRPHVPPTGQLFQDRTA